MTLVEMLNEYFKNHEGKQYPEEGDDIHWLDPDEDEAGKELMDRLWNELFVGSRFNIETRAELMHAGYIVRATDRDSFGILVACIFKDGKGLSIGWYSKKFSGFYSR